MVLDATFPYKTNKDYYMCSLKVVDQSLHPKGGKSEFATLLLYAKRFEDLPIVHRVGDVIRVHRADIRLYKGTRQFNASVYFNASWALFSADKQSVQEQLGQGDEEAKGDAKEYSAYAHSGAHYTLQKAERPTLKESKEWAKDFMTKNDGVSKDMHDSLANASKKKTDFDLLCKILQVLEKDEYTNELKLRDASGAVAYCQALKMKFPHLKAGDAVRIRSALFDETASSKKVVNLSHYSNIMTFPSYSKLAKSVKDSVKDDKAADKTALKSNLMMNPVVLTEVDKKWSDLHYTTLHDLFHNEGDAEIAGKTTFRTQFYVSKIESADTKEWSKSYDKKSKKATSFKGSKAGGNACW